MWTFVVIDWWTKISYIGQSAIINIIFRKLINEDKRRNWWFYCWDFNQSTQRHNNPPTTVTILPNIQYAIIHLMCMSILPSKSVYVCMYSTNKEDSNSAIYKIMNNFINIIIFGHRVLFFGGNFGGNCRVVFW